MSIWSWIKSLIKATVKQLYKLTIDGIKKEIEDILNDAELQNIAKDCIISVANNGFKDTEAWNKALDGFKSKLQEHGLHYKTYLIEGILRNSFTQWKALQESGVDCNECGD